MKHQKQNIMIMRVLYALIQAVNLCGISFIGSAHVFMHQFWIQMHLKRESQYEGNELQYVKYLFLIIYNKEGLSIVMISLTLLQKV